MKKLLLFILWSFVLSAVSSAQSKAKATARPPAKALQKILAGSALPFKIVNDSLAVIPYEGENIPSYQVVIQKAGDLYIVYTVLTEALPGKIDESKYKYLLERNHHFDLVKIGLDDGKDVYVRADVYTANATPALLAKIIRQVANVTNIIGGDLK